jgi:hypothetical protein
LESSRLGDNGLERAPVDAVVLRGGDLTGESRYLNLRRVHEAYGIWGICVTARGNTTSEELAPRVRAGNRMLMAGRANELREKGFDVIREPGHEWPDALIIFPDEPTPDDWTQLRDVMAARPSIRNPNYRGR